MNGRSLKVGDLVTFVYNTPKVAMNFNDPTPLNTQVEIQRVAYARRVLKVIDQNVVVNFKKRKLTIPFRHVQKV